MGWLIPGEITSIQETFRRGIVKKVKLMKEDVFYIILLIPLKLAHTR
jgi:hypothetical protein